MKSVVHAAARAAAAASAGPPLDCGGTLVCATRLRCRPTSSRNALRTTATGQTEASSVVAVSNTAKHRCVVSSVLMNTQHQRDQAAVYSHATGNNLNDLRAAERVQVLTAARTNIDCHTVNLT
jgi:hypothetical protein